MHLTRKTEPSVPLVALPQMKAHLRIGADETDFDAEIEALVAAAVAHIDGPRGVLGRCLSDQVWSLTLDRVSGPVLLPIPFLTSVSAFAEADEMELPLTLEASGIWTKAHITASANGGVRFDMSVTAPADIQAVAVHAIKLLVGHWFVNREAVVVGAPAAVLPMSVDRLLAPLKVGWV